MIRTVFHSMYYFLTKSEGYVSTMKCKCPASIDVTQASRKTMRSAIGQVEAIQRPDVLYRVECLRNEVRPPLQHTVARHEAS